MSLDHYRPAQFEWQLPWAEQEVKNASPAGTGRSVRRVQEKRPHDKRAPDVHLTNNFGASVRTSIVGDSAPVAMRTRHNTERAIIGAARVQMNSHGHELLEHGNGRLHEQAAFLARPAFKRLVGTTLRIGLRNGRVRALRRPDAAERRPYQMSVHSFRDRYAQVTVRRHGPVPPARLLEPGALNRHSGCGQKFREHGVATKTLHQSAAPGPVKQTSCAAGYQSRRRHLRRDPLALAGAENIRHEGAAMFGELFKDL